MASDSQSSSGSFNRYLFFGPTVGVTTAACFAIGAGSANALNDGTAVVYPLAFIAAAAFLVAIHALWKVYQEETRADAADWEFRRVYERGEDTSTMDSSARRRENGMVVGHVVAILFFGALAAIVMSLIVQYTTPLVIFHSGGGNSDQIVPR